MWFRPYAAADKPKKDPNIIASIIKQVFTYTVSIGSINTNKSRYNLIKSIMKIIKTRASRHHGQWIAILKGHQIINTFVSVKFILNGL